MFTSKKEAPLLLKVAAFKYQHYVGIGFAQVSKSEEMREGFGAAKNGPTFMIFKENVSLPHLLLQVKFAHLSGSNCYGLLRSFIRPKIFFFTGKFILYYIEKTFINMQEVFFLQQNILTYIVDTIYCFSGLRFTKWSFG